jgi:hypothetical protein
MSAFRVSAAGLLRLATDGSLAGRVAEHVWMSGHGVNPAERKAWSRSLPVLAQDLADAGLHDVEVLVEYQLPLTSRRIDAVLAGVHPRTGEDSFVVVELKQWSYATRYEDSDTLVDVEHAAGPRLHPGIQAPPPSRAAFSPSNAAANSSTTCAARSTPASQVHRPLTAS